MLTPSLEDNVISVLETSDENERPTSVRITVKIPKDYHNEPIISRLVSEHGLTVNITAAMMGENPNEEGWFNLELTGTGDRIRSALVYLEELDLEIWNKSEDEDDAW